ncbi:uncharacterized protein [Apostichopus japonicus]|uniref:uncharacterized protein isoform X1 n=1 Tax=Stichopus japonicus TaxID=307972 RepID=UPI003AB2206A
MAALKTEEEPPKLLLFTMFAFITLNVNYLITPCFAISKVYIAEGGVIRLNFSFRYNGFGRLELRHNTNVVFARRSAITESNSRTPLLLFNISDGITSFTITDVVSSDNGRYVCSLNGEKQDPVYDLSVILDQQYADDISWASTGQHILQDIEKRVSDKLAVRNLKINCTKTEKFTITRTGNDSWKKCKYVGSLLGTEEDINRRIGITNGAFNTLSNIFKSKNISRKIKLRIFETLLKSNFLYNCELWGTTKDLDCKIDTFQRRLLRNILIIRWTNNNWLSNDELYNETNQTPWSSIVAHRRLRFFGHVARLQEDAPAKVALREALRHTAKPVGRPVTTLLGKIKSQFKDININNFKEAINLAQDRDTWRRLITEHVG